MGGDKEGRVFQIPGQRSHPGPGEMLYRVHRGDSPARGPAYYGASPSREARRVKALGALSQQQRQQQHLINPSFTTH